MSSAVMQVCPGLEEGRKRYLQMFFYILNSVFGIFYIQTLVNYYNRDALVILFYALRTWDAEKLSNFPRSHSKG